jgi:hypothetical protein
VRNARVRTACETYTDFIHLPLVKTTSEELEDFIEVSSAVDIAKMEYEPLGHLGYDQGMM